MSRRRLVLRAIAASPALLLAPAASNAATSTFSLERDGEGFAIGAQALCAATREVVWSTLTDYEALPRFVPGMRESRVIERRGANVIVRQAGTARFGPFDERFDVTLAFEESGGERIEARAIAGDFVEFRAHYALQSVGQRSTLLGYRARLKPRRDPPPLVGAPVMRWVAQVQFRALVEEIVRRQHTVSHRAAIGIHPKPQLRLATALGGKLTV